MRFPLPLFGCIALAACVLASVAHAQTEGDMASQGRADSARSITRGMGNGADRVPGGLISHRPGGTNTVGRDGVGDLVGDAGEDGIGENVPDAGGAPADVESYAEIIFGKISTEARSLCGQGDTACVTQAKREIARKLQTLADGESLPCPVYNAPVCPPGEKAVVPPGLTTNGCPFGPRCEPVNPGMCEKFDTTTQCITGRIYNLTRTEAGCVSSFRCDDSSSCATPQLPSCHGGLIYRPAVEGCAASFVCKTQ